MLPIFISILFAARVVIDVVYSESKPFAIVAVYTLLIIFASFLLVLKSERRSSAKIVVTILFLVISFLVSLLNSDVDIFGHINYAFQILVPALFLLSCTSKPVVLFNASKLFRKFYAIPAVILIVSSVVYSYFTRNTLGLGFIEYYSNSPNHVIAQMVVKISLIFLLDGVAVLFAIFVLLFLVNVRSAIVSFVIFHIIFNWNQFLQKKILRKLMLILIFAVPLLFYFIDVGYFINRFIFRNYDSGESGVAYSISSGRTEIVDYYINYIFDKFGFLDWIFGRGPVWLNSSEMTLSAHNDILNLLTAFGFFGLGLILYVYYRFFITLIPKVRFAAIGMFAVLFLTNGVVFHQSTIFFALLYFYGFNVPGVEVASGLKYCGQNKFK